MRTVSQPLCPNCGADGVEVYSELRDKLYGAPGAWRMQRCRNGRCGVYWGDPTPHPDDLPLAYRNYYTHAGDVEVRRPSDLYVAVRKAYMARRLGYRNGEAWLPRQLSRLVPLLPERSQSALYARFYLPWKQGGRLLEVGCGSGKQLEAMADAGWDARGVDFDPEAVAAARSRGLDVAVGDVRDLHLPAASFDAIVMAHVLEHVFDPVGLLTECARLLKPGGRLVSITPNADSLGHRIFRRAWRGLEPPRHIVIYTPDALRLACARAGLVVDRVDVTARDAANLLLASARIRKSAHDAQIRRPQAGTRPPLLLRMLASVERIGIFLGLAWGEELVLMARR